MANLRLVIDEAASLLNDPQRTEWDFTTLRPYFRKAHRELQLELDMNGIPVAQSTAIILSVPPLVDENNPGINLPNQPADLIEPEQLFERPAGTFNKFVPMKERMWEAEATPGTRLNWWHWNQELVQLLGATQEVDVKLHYLKGLAIPEAESDPLGFINAELFLGPKTAAIAAMATGAPSLAASLNN